MELVDVSDTVMGANSGFRLLTPNETSNLSEGANTQTHLKQTNTSNSDKTNNEMIIQLLTKFSPCIKFWRKEELFSYYNIALDTEIQ